MQQCPMCMREARGLGGVILLTPDQLSGASSRDPITGAACVNCLGLLSMMLDGLQGGRINQLAATLIARGAISIGSYTNGAQGIER